VHRDLISLVREALAALRLVFARLRAFSATNTADLAVMRSPRRLDLISILIRKTHRYVLHDELRTQRHDAIGKAAGKQVTLGAIASNKGMGSFDDPIDIVGDMVEELASMAVLQCSKDSTHMIFIDGHLFSNVPDNHW
jgi:hypothetical protein